MKKKICAVLVSSMMVAAIATGCGGNAATETTTEATTVEDTTEAVSEEVAGGEETNEGEMPAELQEAVVTLGVNIAAVKSLEDEKNAALLEEIDAFLKEVSTLEGNDAETVAAVLAKIEDYNTQLTEIIEAAAPADAEAVTETEAAAQ